MDREQIMALAKYAEGEAEKALEAALQLNEESGPEAALPHLVTAGALYRARDGLLYRANNERG